MKPLNEVGLALVALPYIWIVSVVVTTTPVFTFIWLLGKL